MAEAFLTLGGPGAGKTTFIAHEVARALDAGYRADEVSICSLTRAAAKQAAGKIDLPDQCIGTLHSAAFRALGLSKSQVAESKIDEFNQIATFPISGGDRRDLDDAAPVERKPGRGSGDVLHAAMNVLRAQRVPREQWDPSVEDHAAEWFGWMEREDLVDFTGMLERAVDETYSMPGSPLVMFADEVQDFPKLALDLLEHWADRADKLIMVGDPCQCLYEWAGSDPRHLADMAPVGNRRMLKRSHRVPAAAWRWAADVARTQIERWGMERFEPRDEEGSAEPCAGSSARPEGFLQRVEEDVADGRSVMILATCSYMLRPTIAVLRKLAMPFANPWRPTRGDWNPLAPRRVAKLLDFVEGRQDDVGAMTWLKDLSAKVLARGIKTRLVKGVVDTPRDFAGWCALFASEGDAVHALGERSLDWLEDNLDGAKAKTWEYPLSVLRERGVSALKERPRLFVGTVHSVKGGEADVVNVMPDASPSALEEVMRTGRESMERVFYVAATRARHEVRLLGAEPGTPRFRW